MSAETNIFEWLLAKAPVVIFVLVFIGQIVRGLMRARSERPATQAKPDELEEQRRVQEVQDQIRRRIAERRSAAAPVAPSPVVRHEPVPPRPRHVESPHVPEPPPSPLRRVFEELQREMQPQLAAPPPPPPLPAARAVPAPASRSFELERQQQLADQLRSLEDERVLVKRRASNIAEEKQADAQSETGLRSVARGKLLDDLRAAEGLRRAFVLREVLGTPVGLR